MRQALVATEKSRTQKISIRPRSPYRNLLISMAIGPCLRLPIRLPP